MTMRLEYIYAVYIPYVRVYTLYTLYMLHTCYINYIYTHILCTNSHIYILYTSAYTIYIPCTHTETQMTMPAPGSSNTGTRADAAHTLLRPGADSHPRGHAGTESSGFSPGKLSAAGEKPGARRSPTAPTHTHRGHLHAAVRPRSSPSPSGGWDPPAPPLPTAPPPRAAQLSPAPP